MSLSVQVSFYEGQVCFSRAPGSAAILPDSIQRAHSFPFVLEEARVREDKSALLVPEGREGLRPQVPGWSQGSWLPGLLHRRVLGAQDAAGHTGRGHERLCLPHPAGMLSGLSRVQLFVASWTVAHQAPLSMEFSGREYWSEWPFPLPGDLPEPGIELVSPVCSAGGFFATSASWEALCRFFCSAFCSQMLWALRGLA